MIAFLGFRNKRKKDLYIPCAILCGVWLIHIIYFLFGVKTRKGEIAQR